MMKTNNNEYELPQALDYEQLKAYGLQYIQQIGSKRWTDFNAHDPGVTFWEALCFALTDLGYRTSFEMNDLLASPESDYLSLEAPLFPAHEILSCSPISMADYRKYILEHVPGVKNIWLSPNTARIKKETGNATYIDLKGVYDITIELENKEFLQTEYIRRIVGRDEDGHYSKNYYEEDVPDNYKDCIRHYVWNFLIKHRNLCENFNEPRILEPIEVGICAQIELQLSARPRQVLQEVYDQLEAYISPSLPYHTAAKLLDQGKTPEEIYQGVLPRYGFIDTEELASYNRTTRLNTSDVISLLMKIEGVKSIKHFHFLVDDKYLDSVKFSSSQNLILNSSEHCLRFAPRFACTGKQKKTDSLYNNVTFLFGKFPVYPSEEESKIIPRLSSRLPLNIVWERMNGNDDMQNNIQENGFTFEMPTISGTYRNTGRYYSFQNLFPKAYHLGPEGIADSASDLRKAERLQLKAYLTFFDQLLSDYLAQLDSVSRYFSTQECENPEEQSYFFHQLDDSEIADVSSVLNESEPRTEAPEQFLDRRNRLMDHLMARFNDAFADYSALAYFKNPDNPSPRTTPETLQNKKHIFNAYAANGQERSQGIDYTEPLYVTGLEKRIMYKLGIPHPENRKNLAPELIQCCKDGTHIFVDNRDWPYEETFGIHILEHMLLIPSDNQLDNENFLKLKTQKNSSTLVENPYSFMVTVILPNWLHICQNREFRHWVESCILEEMPAHVITKICWINPYCMWKFEMRYKSYLTTMRRKNYPIMEETWLKKQKEKIKHLIWSFDEFENGFDPYWGADSKLYSNFQLGISHTNGSSCLWKFSTEQTDNKLDQKKDKNTQL